MMEIREGVVEDLPDVRALAAESWQDRPLPFRDRDSLLRTYVDQFHQIVLGAAYGVTAISPGRGVLIWSGDGQEIGAPGIYVRPEYRHQGLGRQLVEFALARAKERGFARVYALPLADTPGADWFQQLGFRPIQVVMVKEF